MKDEGEREIKEDSKLPTFIQLTVVQENQIRETKRRRERQGEILLSFTSENFAKEVNTFHSETTWKIK